MKNKINTFLGLVIAVVIGFFILNKDESITTDAQTSSDSQTLEIKVASTSEKVEPQLMTARVYEQDKKEKILTTITKAEIKAIRDSFPNKQQVKNELNTNPHSPSPSLMSFAKKLGPAMEKAFKNESDANALTRELRDCAINDSVADAARALCVQDVEKLSGYHPDLKTKAQELRSEVTPGVLKILETNDAFIRK